MVNVLLIIAEEFVLLLGKVIGFECHFKAMGRFWGPLDVCIFTLMHSTDKVEPVALQSFLPVDNERCTDYWVLDFASYAFDFGCSLAASFAYSSPSTYLFHRLMTCRWSRVGTKDATGRLEITRSRHEEENTAIDEPYSVVGTAVP